MATEEDELRDQIADLENRLSAEVSARDLTIRDLRTEVGRLRATLSCAADDMMARAALEWRAGTADNSVHDILCEAGECLAKYADGEPVVASPASPLRPAECATKRSRP